jgi:hypothetical protein
MPSKRRQLNVRIDDEAAARFDRLIELMPRVLGFEVSHPQVVALALKALEEKHAGEKKAKK